MAGDRKVTIALNLKPPDTAAAKAALASVDAGVKKLGSNLSNLPPLTVQPAGRPIPNVLPADKDFPSVLPAEKPSWLAGLFDMLKGKGGKGHEQLLGAALGGGSALGQAGGAIGWPLGAIAGAAIAAIAAIAKAIPGVVALPAKAVTAALRGVGDALADLQGPLGPIGAGLDLMGKALGGVASAIKSIPLVGEALGPFADELAAIPGLVGDITQSLVSLAAVASPGAFKLWQRALADVQGVIGQRAVPVLRLLTDGVRFFGDVLATVLPSQQEVTEALGPLKAAWDDLKDSLGDVVTEVGPLLKEYLIDILYEVAIAASIAFRQFKLYADLFKTFSVFSPLAQPGKELKSSFGAAAQTPEFGGLEDLSKKLITAGFESGTSGDPARDTASNSSAILKLLERWSSASTVGQAAQVASSAATGDWTSAARAAILGW